MPRAVLVLSLLLSSWCCWTASACDCQASFGACKEVRVSDLVFIGTVESIEPIFLNRWYATNQSAMQSLNDAFIRAQEHPSAESLRQVKDTYLAMFPSMDEREKKQVQAADTVQQMTQSAVKSCSISCSGHPQNIGSAGISNQVIATILAGGTSSHLV